MFRGPRRAQKTPRANRCLHGDVCTEMSARRCLHGDVCTTGGNPTVVQTSPCRPLRADIFVQTSPCRHLLPRGAAESQCQIIVSLSRGQGTKHRISFQGIKHRRGYAPHGSILRHGDDDHPMGGRDIPMDAIPSTCTSSPRRVSGIPPAPLP